MTLDLNMKILIVDDFSTMRKIVKNMLKQIGFVNIEEAEDGAQAYALLKTGNFHLVISDWNMPTMNGFSLTRKLREDELLRDLPILMVSAEAEKDHVVTAIQAGVNNYILKPFTSELLKEKIETILEKIHV